MERESLQELRFSGELRILGNQAADLDSCVCAVSLAALLEALNPGLRTHPVIRRAPEDLALTPEIPALFSRAGINAEEFCLSPEETERQEERDRPGAQAPIILVDHNSSDPGFPDPLGIVDHHRDERLYTDLRLRKIRRAGSCATLIAEYWFDSGLPLPRAQALLLLSAVAVDTGYLDPAWGKTTAEDRLIYEKLRALLDDEERGFVDGLLELKNDLSHLSLADQLRRDYKPLPLKGLRGGCASVTVLSDRFFDPSYYDRNAVERFMKNNCPDLLLVMHTGYGPFRRQLSLLSSPPQRREQPPESPSETEFPKPKAPVSGSPGPRMEEALRALGGFTPLPSALPGWRIYEQEDVRISRKVLVPLLKDQWER